MPVQETIVLTDNSLPAIHTTPISTPNETTDYLPYLLPAFYFTVSSFLLFRFIRNLTKLLSKIKGNKIVNYSGARLVLTNNNAIPFSFLNYIFINNEKFERGTIEKEVLQHELTHVKQMHSLDVILVELFIALAWFNPLLYLFRRSILLNHEFLADESVVETFNDARSYQLLLFEKANRKNNLILSSSFNYLITKKRLIMMTRKTSQKVAIVKQIAIIPLIAALGFLFSTKVVAQDNTNLLKQKQTENNNVNASQKIVDEYNAKLVQYGLTTKDGKRIPGHKKELSATEKNELGDLYMKMSKSQQTQQIFVFMPNLKGTLPKIVPTNEQFESWKNPNVYGVWIDDKKVDNSVLNKYTNTGFSYGSATYVSKNARIGKKYFMQVNLMTNDYYQKYRSETLARQKNDKNKYMMGFKIKTPLVYKITKDNKAHELNEQEIKLLKEQNALKLDQQKKELKNKLDSKSLSEQKVKLDKEQQAELNLQKVKMEKEMQAKMKDQEVIMKQQEAKIKSEANKTGMIKIIFNNKFTSEDLTKIKDELKSKGITLIYNKLEFGLDRHLTSIDFTVDCNDGFKGSAGGHPLTNKNFEVGFYRDYSKNSKSAFGAGYM